MKPGETIQAWYAAVVDSGSESLLNPVAPWKHSMAPPIPSDYGRHPVRIAKMTSRFESIVNRN